MLAVTRLCLARTPAALRLTALDALQSVMQGIEEVKAVAPNGYDVSFVEKVYAHLKPETKRYLENETAKMQNELDATMSCVRETVWEFFDLERTGASQIQKVTNKKKKVVASKKRPAVSKKTSAKGLLKSKRINKLLKKGKAAKAASKADAVETAPKKAVSEKAAKIKKAETNAEKKTEGNIVQVKATKKVGKPSKAEQAVSKPEPEAKSVNDDVLKP